MKKKKLNEVPTVSALKDSEYIVVTMQDGAIGRIKKSELYPVASSLNNGLLTINQYLSVSGYEILGKSDERIIKIAEVSNDQSIIIQSFAYRTQARVPRVAFVGANLYKNNTAHCTANSLLGENSPFYYKIENDCLHLYALLPGWFTLRVTKLYGTGQLMIKEADLNVNDLISIE